MIGDRAFDQLCLAREGDQIIVDRIGRPTSVQRDPNEDHARINIDPDGFGWHRAHHFQMSSLLDQTVTLICPGEIKIEFKLNS